MSPQNQTIPWQIGFGLGLLIAGCILWYASPPPANYLEKRALVVGTLTFVGPGAGLIVWGVMKWIRRRSKEKHGTETRQ